MSSRTNRSFRINAVSVPIVRRCADIRRHKWEFQSPTGIRELRRMADFLWRRSPSETNQNWDASRFPAQIVGSAAFFSWKPLSLKPNSVRKRVESKALLPGRYREALSLTRCIIPQVRDRAVSTESARTRAVKSGNDSCYSVLNQIQTKLMKTSNKLKNILYRESQNSDRSGRSAISNDLPLGKGSNLALQMLQMLHFQLHDDWSIWILAMFPIGCNG
jgi:hypothetical protein